MPFLPLEPSPNGWGHGLYSLWTSRRVSRHRTARKKPWFCWFIRQTFEGLWRSMLLYLVISTTVYIIIYINMSILGQFRFWNIKRCFTIEHVIVWDCRHHYQVAFFKLLIATRETCRLTPFTRQWLIAALLAFFFGRITRETERLMGGCWCKICHFSLGTFHVQNAD